MEGGLAAREGDHHGPEVARRVGERLQLRLLRLRVRLPVVAEVTARVAAHRDVEMDEHRAPLEAQPGVERVYYPGLPSHPQHALAMRQQKSGGGIVAFDVKGGKDAAWKVVDNTRLMSITANLGDTKTTITHPATTTHGRITPEARAAAGIKDGLLRVAVGLEALEDLKADLARGLA